MDLGNGLGLLTYSTLVHPADNWEQLWTSLNTYLPKVKARVAGNKSFGVCIRLSAKTAETLANSPAERDKLKKFLDDNDMYIYTANAFVYGHFKGDTVKEQVYEPDWRTEERTQYTINVANVLADVCPARHRAVDPERAARLQAARHRRRCGRGLHRQCAARGRASDRARGQDRLAPCSSRSSRSRSAFSKPPTRAIAYLPRSSLFRRGGREARQARAHPDRRGQRRAAPPSRHRLRHLPPGGRIRGHHRVAAEAGRRRRAGVQAAGSRRAAHAGGDQAAVDTLKRYAKTIYLTQTLEKTRRQDHPLPQCRRRHRRVREGSGAARMAHPHPRAGVPRRSRPVPHHALCHRRGAARSTRRSRCRASSRSRPIPGTCCPTASRPATSSTMSAARSSGCATS